jgi:hypothetical protein
LSTSHPAAIELAVAAVAWEEKQTAHDAEEILHLASIANCLLTGSRRKRQFERL